jgi:outer membrane protein assembly factor BamB
VIAGGTLFASIGLTTGFRGNAEGIVALDPATGARHWCRTGYSSYFYAPAVADGVVIVGGEHDAGVLYPGSVSVLQAFDAKTGAVKWRYFTSGFMRAAIVANGVVYTGTADGWLVALDLKTGQRRWSFQMDPEHDPNLGTAVPAAGMPAVVDGVVYSATGRIVYALSAKTGEELWRYDPPGNDESVNGVPTVVDGTVYVSGFQNLMALDVKTGKPRWQTSLSGFTTNVAVANGTVFVATGYVYDSSSTSNPVIAGLYAFAAKDGHQRWKLPVKGFVTGNPVVADGVVYLSSVVNGQLSAQGTLRAINARTGKAEWTYALDGPPTEPVVLDGMIFIGTAYPYSPNSGVNPGEPAALYALGGATSSHPPRTQQASQP